MPADPAARMRRLFDCAWNEGETGVVDEIVAEDFVFNRGGTLHKGGPDLYKDLINDSREMFPDMEFSLTDVIVGDDGETVVLAWTMTGTHEGEYKGVAPTDQTVELDGIEINRFENGELAETQTHPNWVGFLEDIGVLPLDTD